MIVILFFTFLVANIAISLFHRSSKPVAFMLWLTLLFVYAGNIRDGFSDLPAYRVRYNEGTSSVYFSDRGYTVLADVLSNHGVSFQIFLAILFIVSSVCMYIVLRKLNANYNVFISLVSLFYLFFAMEGIRFSLAFGFAFVGIYLIKDGTFRNRLVFVLLVLIGSLFHKSVLAVLPFVFIYRRGGLDKRTKKILFYALGVICLLLIVLNLVSGNSGAYLEKYFSLLGDDSIMIRKANFYVLNQKRVRLGYLYYFVYYAMNVLIMYSVNKLYEKSSVVKTQYANIVYQFNLYSMIFLPFIMIATAFFRVLLLGCVASFMAVSELMNGGEIFSEWKRKRQKEWYYILVAVLVWVAIWWHLKINVIGPVEALQQNLFY